jgi:class 3 adenylate cyclase/tetratricopeptide (TPR) repeat protein
MPLTCPSCGAQNEDGRKFCGDCAARLSVTCPACGTANAPTAKFCGECAAPLRTDVATGGAEAAGRSAAHAPTVQLGGDGGPAAERRLVSVLFADLVGFTPFSEERDAEEVREILGRYFDLASEVISRYGGTIEKFIGDAVMAVWGTPVAREDDAERAVRAGLELVDAVHRLGPSMQARCGVLTGEAAVTLGATNQGMVAGDLVNTASRLQSVAPAGAVLVGEATRLAAARAIIFEEAGEQALKGKVAPVPAWRAVRVVAERGGRNRSEVEAPFVGRDEELHLLKELFHATERERRLRLVSVMGPAGIGKSRLAWEFLKYVDGLVEQVWWHDGRSPAYGEGISFWALGEMIRARCSLIESDDEATTRGKVAERVAEHVPDEAERDWIERSLLALLGLESGAGSEELFAAWRTFFERLAASGPVVLVFEDLHFADPGLLDFIDHLLDWSRGVPIFVVTLARPELIERRTDWGAAKRNFVSLTLEPLRPEAMRELLAGLVPGLPRGASDAIVERADGIPLYAVETVRMLLAKGKLRREGDTYAPAADLGALSVPDTLTALIASRLDGLAQADRSLLQDAAVLGQSFTVAGLAAISGIEPAELERRLRALVQKELLRLEVDARSPEQGQYVFVQALIREVAYNTLAKRERKSRHLAAARYFESLGSEELAGALAAQYLAALENAPEGPEAAALAGQARIALKAAAERAQRLGSLGQAVAFFDQARAIATDHDEQVDLLGRAGMAATRGGLPEIAEERLREAIERRRKSGNRAGAARATTLLGDTLATYLHREAAQTLLGQAVEEFVGKGIPADPELVALLAQAARVAFLSDALEESLALADRALEAAERLDLVSIVADLLVTRGMTLVLLGRSYEGTGAMETGLKLAESHELWDAVLRARLNLGVSQTDSDPHAAYESAQAALELATRLGRKSTAVTLFGNAASAAVDIGEWDLAEQQYEERRDQQPDEFGQNYVDWVVIGVRAFRGTADPDEVERLVAWARGFGDERAAEGIHDLRASVAFGLGRYGEASREWAAYAPSQKLNAPTSWYQAAIAGLAARDAVAAGRAVDAHLALPAHGRLVANDRTMLRAGVALLTRSRDADGATSDLLAAADFYRQRRLPWRLALTGLVAAGVADQARPKIGKLVDEARAVLLGLGAAPLAAGIDELAGIGPAPPDVTAKSSAGATVTAESI